LKFLKIQSAIADWLLVYDDDLSENQEIRQLFSAFAILINEFASIHIFPLMKARFIFNFSSQQLSLFLMEV